VRDRDGYTSCALFGRIIDLIERLELDIGVPLGERLRDRRSESGLTMVNMTHGPDVQVRLTPLELLLGHVFTAPLT
jgi:hypothetical protein